jgi:hypothetical protein
MNYFYILLSIFFAFLFCYNSNGAKAPVCTGVNFLMNVSRQSDSKVVFIYSADISLLIADSIHTIVTLDNHTYWSLNSSEYFQFEPAQYWDIEQGMIKCPTLNSTCNLTAFDSAGWYEIPLSLNGQKLFPSFTDFLVFDQGSVFFKEGYLFDPNTLQCSGSEEIVLVGPAYNTNFNYCCNAYTYVDIPDSNPNPCIEFDGNTTLYNSNGRIISSFSAHYLIDSSSLNVSVSDFSSIPNSYYDFIPNYGVYGCPGQAVKNCTFSLPLNPNFDYQFDMMLSVYDSTKTYGTTVGGKILRRNGIFVRHRNEVYSPSDPCWIRTFPSNAGSKAVNSFCCTKFKSSKFEIENLIKSEVLI